MEKTEIKTRSAYWDNIKGILMILTVFAHILFQLQDDYSVIDHTVDLIYMFHMPAFVFVSGYFGKSERSHSFESIIKLIFLYFIFNSIMGFIYGFNSLLQPVYSYWYLVALAVWRLSAHHIAKFRAINLILIAAALIVGFYPSVNNTFAAARIIGFYPYYMAGYMLSKEKSDELINKTYIKRVSMGALAAIAVSVSAYAAYSVFGYSDAALQMAGYSVPTDIFGRIALYVIAFLAVYALRCLSPDKNIPFVTMCGRNSLWIFILHRPFTLILSSFTGGLEPYLIILIAIAGTAVICLLFGNDFVVRYMNRFMDQGAAIFTSDSSPKMNVAKLTAIIVAAIYIIPAVVPLYMGTDLNTLSEEQSDENDSNDIIWRTMTDEQEQAFDNAFRITFAGDLILLEDQVKRAYTGDGYDFTDVFEYAAPYISSADYAIGVFEGPMAGADAGYTTSNFDDGKSLYLNFPDQFASAVKEAGFDLVTTANNHLLDKGEEGALRTLEVLDSIGLDHTGSYKSEEDKKSGHIKLVECRGIKMVILSYTYGSNYTDKEELAAGSLSYLTSVISGTEGELFEKLKSEVESDMKTAKELSPDLIIVLPHIGTQFSNDADEERYTSTAAQNRSSAAVSSRSTPTRRLTEISEPCRSMT